jgi:hypothetical protein
MRDSRWLWCCWPGLPRIWFSGDWCSLAVALAFGLALNFLLIASLPGQGWLPPRLLAVGWAAAGGFWIYSAIRSWRLFPSLRHPQPHDDQGLFIRAQAEYLRGHWFETESLLKQLLAASHEDIDAHLLLASLYRRTRRHSEAAAQLLRLEQLERAAKWRWEMAAERRLLERQIEEDRNGPPAVRNPQSEGERQGAPAGTVLNSSGPGGWGRAE